MGEMKRGPRPACRVLPPAWVEQAIAAVESKDERRAAALALILERLFPGPFEEEARAEAEALARWLRAVS
jgi:hypothetical protein